MLQIDFFVEVIYLFISFSQFLFLEFIKDITDLGFVLALSQKFEFFLLVNLVSEVGDLLCLISALHNQLLDVVLLFSYLFVFSYKFSLESSNLRFVLLGQFLNFLVFRVQLQVKVFLNFILRLCKDASLGNLLVFYGNVTVDLSDLLIEFIKLTLLGVGELSKFSFLVVGSDELLLGLRSSLLLLIELLLEGVLGLVNFSMMGFVDFLELLVIILHFGFDFSLQSHDLLNKVALEILLVLLPLFKQTLKVVSLHCEFEGTFQ